MDRDWTVFTKPKYSLGAVFNAFGAGAAFASLLVGIKVGDGLTMGLSVAVLTVCGYYVFREVK